jgi:hypothetical protein
MGIVNPAEVFKLIEKVGKFAAIYHNLEKLDIDKDGRPDLIELREKCLAVLPMIATLKEAIKEVAALADKLFDNVTGQLK